MIKHNKIPVHVSVDLESLDLQPSAVVVAIGLAAFTVAGGVSASHYSTLTHADQIAVGRTKDPGTIEWWGKQPPEVREALDQDRALPTATVLRHVTSFFERFYNNQYYIAGVWGFGSDFDNAMLISLFASFGIPLPWDYRANRCGRTLVKELGTPAPKARWGTIHNAVHDAVWQADWFRASLHDLAAAKRTGAIR